MSVTEMRLLETFNSSLVVNLSKRKLVAKYTPLFKERGYNVLDLNFVNPVASNVSYDPLTYIKNYMDITFLSQAIVRSDPRSKNSNADPYWEQSAISLLSAEIAYVLITKENPSFNDVLNVQSELTITEDEDSIKTSMDDKFAKLKSNNLVRFANSCWRTFRQLPMRTAGCVYSCLNTTLDSIFGLELRKLIARKDKLDFKKIADEKTLLFVSTSAVNPALKFYANLFYCQMFKELFEYAESRADLDYALPNETHIICDDFATSQILNFSDYISVFREKKISVTLLIQSESQLESLYGADDATTIRNNCDTYAYFGSCDLNTAKDISERLNVPLEEVLYMPLAKVVIFRRGSKPIIANRYRIKENRLYQKISKQYESAIRAC
jgi:type IV secretory pathway TraG/TraD family ATPase VirD4